MGSESLSRQSVSVFALAAATLVFESTLTRLLGVAQYYHFAFLVVSLALLGFGASGTMLSVFPDLRQMPIHRLLFWAGIGFALGVGLAFATINWLPFDAYRIAWERRQIAFFALYYLALTFPFVISGLGVGAVLARASGKSHLIYATNLLGSAFGALVAPLILSLAGVPGAVLLSVCIGLVAAIPSFRMHLSKRWKWSGGLTIGSLCLGLISFGWLVAINWAGHSPLGIAISPYKGLAYARQYPGSELLFGRWNAISRLDVIANAGTRQLPGLSYQFDGSPPDQLGLSIDADALQPITLTAPRDFSAAAWMPEALAFDLSPDANVLVIEPGGGLGILQAMAGGATQVTAVVENSLIPQAVLETASEYDIYHHPQVDLVHETSRVYLQRSPENFDIVYLSLSDAYRPVTSGAYSLAEDYTLTVEAMHDVMAALSPEGIFVVTRWLQSPPSESIRLIATLVEALSEIGVTQPGDAILAYRSIQTMTVLVKPAGWDEIEVAVAGEFLESRRFDWVWGPDLQQQEINRFNRLPEPIYYTLTDELLSSEDSGNFYASYPYRISPARDDKPFFFHFFTNRQTEEILQTLGHTWQPFGGSGYLILYALLALVLTLSGTLIVLPLLWKQNMLGDFRITPKLRWHVLLYFSLLGIAFLFIEIPLIQRWILILGQPIYAFAVVVAALLTASGIGSMLAKQTWMTRRVIFSLLIVMIVSIILLTGRLSLWLSIWPMWGRVIATVIILVPLGLFMGVPFPLGLAWLEDQAPGLMTWAWAINGCASVIASVLAAILTLSFGFTQVLILGTAAYLGAWLILERTDYRR